MPTYASIFVNVFPQIPAKADLAFPRALLTPPHYELHPEDPLEFDTVPFGFYISGVPRMMFDFLRKTKRKMVADAFVLFDTVAPELNGGS